MTKSDDPTSLLKRGLNRTPGGKMAGDVLFDDDDKKKDRKAGREESRKRRRNASIMTRDTGDPLGNVSGQRV